MSDTAPPERQGPVDSVLLIDGDNDPHFPPDFPITVHTLVRVFLRPGAKMPRTLERKFAGLPMCVPVVSPQGGANAADFVMSLHAGLLHATLPLQLPFMMVTNDQTLAAMCQELQRLGRQASLWTSHPEGGGRRAPASASESSSSSSGSRSGSRSRRGGSSSRGRGRRSSGGRAAAKPAARPAAPPATSVAAWTEASEPLAAAAPAAKSAPRSGRSLADVASAYAARLGRIKDPPTRLRALMNDIKHRASLASGYTPEAILEELKLSHGFTIDERGKVSRKGA